MIHAIFCPRGQIRPRVLDLREAGDCLDLCIPLGPRLGGILLGPRLRSFLRQQVLQDGGLVGTQRDPVGFPFFGVNYAIK